MVTNRLHLWDLKRVFTLYAYFLAYGIRAHRQIVAIDAWFVACDDIFAFEAIAEKAHKRDPASHAPPLIHILGGSTFGGFTDLVEMRIWIQGLVHGLALHTALVALHLGANGRCDFHLLTPNLKADGRQLYDENLRENARALARELTTQLNERRLCRGILPIGNLSPEGEVFFLDPRLELVAPPPIARESQATVTSPMPPPAGPASTASAIRPAAPGVDEAARRTRTGSDGDIAPGAPDGEKVPQAPQTQTDPLLAARRGDAMADAILLQESGDQVLVRDVTTAGEAPLAEPAPVAIAAVPQPPPGTVAPASTAPAAATFAPQIQRPPVQTPPAPATGSGRVNHRACDLATIAAAVQDTSSSKQAAATSRQDEAEADAKKRARQEDYRHFLMRLRHLQHLVNEAESWEKRIHARAEALRKENLRTRADDPLLLELLDQGRRFTDDPPTRSALAAEFSDGAKASRTLETTTTEDLELRTLKHRCQDAQDQARGAHADLVTTLESFPSVREAWRREIEDDGRGQRGPELT